MELLSATHLRQIHKRPFWEGESYRAVRCRALPAMSYREEKEPSLQGNSKSAGSRRPASLSAGVQATEVGLPSSTF